MGELVSVYLESVRCAKCGVPFSMPDTLVAQRKKDGETFYCPNGHSHAYPKQAVDTDKLKVELKQAVDARARADSRAESADRESQRLTREIEEMRAASMRKPAAPGEYLPMEWLAIFNRCKRHHSSVAAALRLLEANGFARSFDRRARWVAVETDAPRPRWFKEREDAVLAVLRASRVPTVRRLSWKALARKQRETIRGLRAEVAAARETKPTPPPASRPVSMFTDGRAPRG